MKISKVVPVFGLAVATAYAEPEAACGSVPTVYTTVPGTPVTETFTLTVAAPNVQSLSTNAAGESITASGATATTTSHMTLTDVVSIAEPSSTSAIGDQGLYSFNVNNGITSWFGGKTPPATASLVTSTSIVTLVPVPESSPVSVQGPEPTVSDAPTTSYTTTFLTSVVSEIHTETLTESVPSGGVSTKIFSGLGSSGWNTTYTTLRTIKASEDGSRVAKPAFPKTAINDKKLLPVSGSALTLPASSPSIGLAKHKHARQVGAVVSAIINGVVVSWTNSYQGSSTATSAPVPTPEAPMAPSSLISSVALTSVVPVYPWQLSSKSIASTVAGSDTLTSAPTTTLPVYSWNLSPSPTPASSISSNLTSFSSGWIQPGIPSIQPVSSSVSSVSPSIIVPSLPASSASVSHTLYTTSATSTAATTPTSCGTQTAEFTINFDDLPTFSTGPDNTDIPPILNPYYKLFFEAGFGYVPPPSDPFPPTSLPQLAVYRKYNKADLGLSPDAELQLPGEIGAGPRASESAYWIDAYSAYLGCNNSGPAGCTITVNGYNHASRIPQVTQTTTQPACPGLVNCFWKFVEFSEEFRDLSGIQFLATVGGKPVDWYMDDLALGWSNNTCAAQFKRASAH